MAPAAAVRVTSRRFCVNVSWVLRFCVARHRHPWQTPAGLPVRRIGGILVERLEPRVAVAGHLLARPHPHCMESLGTLGISVTALSHEDGATSSPPNRRRKMENNW